MKKYINVIVSLTLIVAAVGLIFFWEMYLDDTINTVEVVVAVKNLEKNQVIKTGDVKIAKIKVEHAVDDPVNDINEIIGKETSQYVPKGNQFVDRMIDKYNLEPNADQYIYSIPKDWIYSTPGSLRRKDRVYIYPIPSPPIAASRGSAGPGLTELTKNNGTQSELSTSSASSKIVIPILKDIVVAFAKDSSNHEIKPAANSDKRIDATGSISNLELVMTETQYSSLEKKFLEGYKFNFAYR